MNSKEIEQSIKNYILVTYGRYLSPQKVSFLTSKDYSSFTTISDISKNIFNDLLDTITHKEIMINAEESYNIPYGESLKNVLVQYLTKKINTRFHLNINNGPVLEESLNELNALDQKYFEIIEENAFTKNALELENVEELSQIVKKYGLEDLQKYQIKLNNLKVNNNKEPNNKEVDVLKLINQSNPNNQIPTLYENNNIENLSLDELKELRQDIINNQDNEVKVSKSNSGMAFKSFAIYIVVLTLVLVVLFLAIIKM